MRPPRTSATTASSKRAGRVARARGARRPLAADRLGDRARAAPPRAPRAADRARGAARGRAGRAAPPARRLAAGARLAVAPPDGAPDARQRAELLPAARRAPRAAGSDVPRRRGREPAAQRAAASSSRYTCTWYRGQQLARSAWMRRVLIAGSRQSPRRRSGLLPAPRCCRAVAFRSDRHSRGGAWHRRRCRPRRFPPEPGSPPARAPCGRARPSPVHRPGGVVAAAAAAARSRSRPGSRR